MPKTTKAVRFVKAVHPSRPKSPYYLPAPDRRLIKRLAATPFFAGECERPCTTVLTLLPKVLIKGSEGKGYYMVNVDGYRMINAYVISDRLTSTTQKGFSLELSFSVNPFVYGVGVVGETSFFFNFDNYYDPTTTLHKTICCKTSYLGASNVLPRIGGVDFTHLLRVPVMGPYVRASAFNEDTVARNVEVKAYLTT